MSQQITITIDGKDGRVPPESVSNVLRAIFGLLESLDRRSWKVGTARVRWRVSDARLVNPLTVTGTGDPVLGDTAGAPPGLAIDAVERLRGIVAGVRPNDFTPGDWKLARLLGVEAKRCRGLIVEGSVNGKSAALTLPRSFSADVRRVSRARVQVTHEYGSLDGTLIRLANDPLKSGATAVLRDRGGAEVLCHANPETAARMAGYLNRQTRVILYGTIRLEDGAARHVHVEDFTTVPAEDELPTLEDLHALHLRPPGEKTVEEYLEELRGDD